MPLTLLDTDDNALADQVPVRLRRGKNGIVAFKVKNETGGSVTDIDFTFASGIGLAEGQSLPLGLANGAETVISCDVTAYPVGTQDRTITIDSSDGEVIATFRVTVEKPKVGGRTARKRAKRN